MTNLNEEWNAPTVEALTQANGVDESSKVAFRNGLGLSPTPTLTPAPPD